MAHPIKPFPCIIEADKTELQRLAADTSDVRMAVRAQIILESSEGKAIAHIAEKLGERPNTVSDWRERYICSGIPGLKNLPRGSSRSLNGEQFTQRLNDMLATCPPDGATYWTGPMLAQSLGVSENTIRKYLTKAGIHLKELRSNPMFWLDDPGPAGEPDCTTVANGSVCELQEAGDVKAGEPVCNGGEIPSAEVDEVPSREKETEVNAGGAEENEMLDLVYVAQFVKKDGSVVASRTVTVTDAAPGVDAFDISSASGFREDFAHVETSVIEGFGKVTTGVVGLYLTETSKKTSDVARNDDAQVPAGG